MPSDQELLIRIREIVIEHYKLDSPPLLLSGLGARLHKENLGSAIGEGRTLRQLIDAANDTDLLIVRDRNSPAYVAVATAASKQAVEAWIERRSQTTATISDLEALPWAVLLAFCMRPDPGHRVFLRKAPPFKI